MSKVQNINLDGILEEIGEMGRYQVHYYVLFSFIVILTSSGYLGFIFTAGQLDYRCKIPECDSFGDSGLSEYRPNWLPLAVPYKTDGTPTRCQRFAYIGDRIVDKQSSVEGYRCDQSSFNRSEEIRCNTFVFDTDEVNIVNTVRQTVDAIRVNKITVKFNVTCEENQWRLAMIGTLSSIPEYISMPICAFLSDKFGRRPILIGTLLLTGICGVIQSFSNSYNMFVAMELTTSLVSGGTYMTIYVMAIEFAGPKKRVFSGTLISVMYSFSQVLTGIVAMFFHNFRVFLRLLFVPNLLVLTFFWLMPESVRWLLTKGKIGQAREILMRAAKINGVELSENYKEILYEKNESVIETDNTNTETSTNNKISEHGINSYKIAFQSGTLVLRLANCLFCWFANSFIYYGLTVNSVTLAGNKYMNYIYVNLVEVPAVLLASYLMEKVGRKRVLCTCLLTSGIACVATEFIPPDGHIVRLIMFVIGKCGVTISFTVIYVFSSELFPTVVRHSFMNACSTAGGMGSIIALLTPLLANTWSALPLLMFGGTALASGFFVLLLPETHNTKLPDTVKEAINIGK